MLKNREDEREPDAREGTSPARDQSVCIFQERFSVRHLERTEFYWTWDGNLSPRSNGLFARLHRSKASTLLNMTALWGVPSTKGTATRTRQSGTADSPDCHSPTFRSVFRRRQ